MSAVQQGGGLTEQQKKNIAVVAFVLVGVGVMGYELKDLFFGSTPPPPPAPVIVSKPAVAPATHGNSATVAAPPGFVVKGAPVKGEAVKVGTASVALDPTLHMEAMRITESLVYTGKGRNIFAAGPYVAETALAEVKHDRKPLPQPIAPVRVADLGPPPPPPIDLKFFGTASRANGDRRAMLLHGEDVFLASPGDIVERRYKVITIAAGSIVIEDLPNSNRQTLPLQVH
ncbi:hypothetical protein FTO74_01555 [Granulicella sp. WH15]|uniref:hypothetical protein n=1 Tax=Granulicella sp. WH15 TaxID=2602070 RepID=UPI00136684B7|nr:hypothetical protein [Granulicella sp. WH15]QHN02210.1 hypothetical protein FTO74_01555 [Granulicella sp. WH15]